MQEKVSDMAVLALMFKCYFIQCNNEIRPAVSYILDALLIYVMQSSFDFTWLWAVRFTMYASTLPNVWM